MRGTTHSGSSALSVCDRVMLTKEQLAYFDTFGFLFLKQAFSADEMTALISAAEEVWKANPPPQQDGEQRLNYFVERHPALSQLVIDERIYPAVGQLMGRDFVWAGSEGNISGLSQIKWHPDRKYYNPDEERFVDFAQMKVMIYLQTVTRDSGCLRVIPGSHRMPYHKALGPQELDPDAQPFGLAPEDIPCVYLESEPGDVILFNHMMWHSQFGGREQRRYIALKFTACPSSEHHLASLERYSIAVFEQHEAFVNHDDPRIRAMARPIARPG